MSRQLVVVKVNHNYIESCGITFMEHADREARLGHTA